MRETLEIVLDEAAFADLNALLSGFRHADALTLIEFLNRRVRRRPAADGSGGRLDRRE